MQTEIYDTTQVREHAEALAGHIREVMSQKSMAEAGIADLERQHNEIIHRLEQDDCLFDERARLATQLAKVRKERRRYKDWLYANQRYFNLLTAEEGKRIQGILANLVSVGRKVEAAPGRHKNP